MSLFQHDLVAAKRQAHHLESGDMTESRVSASGVFVYMPLQRTDNMPPYTHSSIFLPTDSPPLCLCLVLFLLLSPSEMYSCN